MVRRAVYACAGALLSAGAPVGLLGLRLALRRRFSARAAVRELRRHRLEYLYVGGATAVAFAVFGYSLGRQADWFARLSETDPVTGLANARAFFDRLASELARAQRYRQPLALLLVDLDSLKTLNDRHGHAAGDEALRHLATVIRKELRGTDFGARWGGDEFAVLAPGTSRMAASALAERIRALVPLHGGGWPLTASIGVATVEPDGDRHVVDSATLMRTADAALYQAKRAGRNRVQVAGHPDTASARVETIRGVESDTSGGRR